MVLILFDDIVAISFEFGLLFESVAVYVFESVAVDTFSQLRSISSVGEMANDNDGKLTLNPLILLDLFCDFDDFKIDEIGLFGVIAVDDSFAVLELNAFCCFFLFCELIAVVDFKRLMLGIILSLARSKCVSFEIYCEYVRNGMNGVNMMRMAQIWWILKAVDVCCSL